MTIETAASATDDFTGKRMLGAHFGSALDVFCQHLLHQIEYFWFYDRLMGIADADGRYFASILSDLFGEIIHGIGLLEQCLALVFFITEDAADSADTPFVSADWKEPYDTHSWDKEVVDRIRKLGTDARYGVEITCTDDVHKSVIYDEDCRRCEIKEECRSKIKLSSIVIFVVGDNTARKAAGGCDSISCSPAYSGAYKKNCKYFYKNFANPFENGRKMSYLQYEITTAVKEKKKIILVYNSARKEVGWIPAWYNTLLNNNVAEELCRVAFWKDGFHTKDCYQDIKQYL